MIKVVNNCLRIPIIQQLMRFGFIGFFATFLSYLLVIFFVEAFHFNPLVANFIAFLIAFQVSFWGHKSWTFRAHSIPHRQAMVRFFTLSIFGFILNESLYAFFLHVVHMHYALALLIVLMIVPPITFVVSKFWAFKL